MKKRVLLCNEASFLLTGFGNYGKALLNALVDSDKFHVAEHATYGRVNDPRDKDVRWRYYANEVPENDPRYQEYKSKVTNQFGEWRFEHVLLDFKPDIVITIRDPWMDAFVGSSPLRRFYHWVTMPTVDSVPQKDEWIESFITADGVFTYSDWAVEVLRQEGMGKINLQRSAWPGVDTDVFKPVKDKGKHRKEMGFNEDSIIIGTVMRNQVRKLYPDLFYSFRKFLDSTTPEIAKKTFLYVHTSFPDVGWDIPALLKEFNLGNKVLFTYICKVTKKPFCSFFQDARTYSPFSNGATGTLPNTQHGLTLEQMADVYNLFDLYVQYATCEGCGMPQIEAAACGVPIASVDYSAMSDVVRLTGGIPIKVQRMFREHGTNSYRAYPDNEQFAQILHKFCDVKHSGYEGVGIKARKAVERHFNWDKTTKIWIDYLDNVQLKENQGNWDAPLQKLYNVPSQIPQGLSNPELVNWFFNVVGEPDEVNTLLALTILRDLNYGITFKKGKAKPINKQELFTSFKSYAEKKNLCERARCGIVKIDTPDFVEYARITEQRGKE